MSPMRPSTSSTSISARWQCCSSRAADGNLPSVQEQQLGTTSARRPHDVTRVGRSAFTSRPISLHDNSVLIVHAISVTSSRTDACCLQALQKFCLQGMRRLVCHNMPRWKTAAARLSQERQITLQQASDFKACQVCIGTSNGSSQRALGSKPISTHQQIHRGMAGSFIRREPNHGAVKPVGTQD